MEAYKNYMKVVLKGESENEALSRMIAAAFLVQFDPTMEEMDDVKTAVSEGVTNAIIHGYADMEGEVILEFLREDRILTITISDMGRGMEDVKQAMQPMYTTKPEMERSGMGFTFMEAFMDELKVFSRPGKGTQVVMKKNMGGLRNQR